MDIQLSELSSATSPEEFAQQFLAAVSKGLAKLVADQLGDVVKQASTASLGPQVSGWQGFIGGCVMDLAWERPLGRPVGQVVAFCPMLSSGVAIAGVQVGVGITISANF